MAMFNFSDHALAASLNLELLIGYCIGREHTANLPKKAIFRFGYSPALSTIMRNQLDQRVREAELCFEAVAVGLPDVTVLPAVAGYLPGHHSPDRSDFTAPPMASCRCPVG